MAGWIKLHRKIKSSAVFDNPKVLKVWIWCLAKASHKEHDMLVGMTPVHLMPGQFVYGRYSAAEELKMPPSTVRNCMEVLQKLKNVDIKADSLFSIVTVENWAFYQDDAENKDSDKDKERTKKGHKQKGKEGKETKGAFGEILPNSRAYREFPPDEPVEAVQMPEELREKIGGILK